VFMLVASFLNLPVLALALAAQQSRTEETDKSFSRLKPTAPQLWEQARTWRHRAVVTDTTDSEYQMQIAEAIRFLHCRSS
jgi:hypothetical protein